MATTIKLKNGSGAPLAGDLVQGEPALDLTNKRLYTENASGTVIEVGTNPTSLTTGTFTSTGIDDNATSTAITIDSDGDVGIGLASPLFQATDRTAVTINGTTSSNLTFGVGGSANTYFLADSAGFTIGNTSATLPTMFYTNGSERARIDSSGNVGIGTSDPSSFSIDTGPDIILGDGTDNPHLSIVSPTTGTGYVAFADGTAGTAKYSGLIEYAHTTDHMGLRTGGTERMRIDSSGNVGIGTSSPATDLSVSSSGAEAKIFVGRQVTSGNLSNTAGGGSIEFGSADSSTYAEYSGASIKLVADQNWTVGSAQGSALAFSVTADGTASLSEAMRIDSSGDLLVGTTTSRGRITSEASSGFCFDGYITTSTAGQDIFVIRSDVGGTANANLVIEANGDVQNTNNSYGSISDERLKSNIVDASSQIDDIMAVQVRSYTLNKTGNTHIGVVAQELEASGMSGLVKTDDEGMKSVKYSVLYMKAIKALQEAVTRIETLEAEVAALKGA